MNVIVPVLTENSSANAQHNIPIGSLSKVILSDIENI